MLVVTAYIENFGDGGFVAFTKKFKGLVVQANTLEEVKKEFWKSLKVKLAYDYNLDIRNIVGEEVDSVEELNTKIVRETEHEFDLALL